jgi:hypothetical protein
MGEKGEKGKKGKMQADVNRRMQRESPLLWGIRVPFARQI